MAGIKSKLIETLPDFWWIRTCQECGHKQGDSKPDPNKELSNAFRDRKCKKCKSEALDYGTQDVSWDYPDEE